MSQSKRNGAKLVVRSHDISCMLLHFHNTKVIEPDLQRFNEVDLFPKDDSGTNRQN